MLVGGSLLPRMLDSLRRFHPWLWFFSEASLVNTRVVRFLMSFYFILTSVFISTVLYGVYYPVTNSCASFNGRGVECLQVPSPILSGDSQCSYDISNGVCSLRPPPQDAAFLIIVAFATVVVMIPFNLIFYLMMRYVCSKRPRLEALGCNTFELLGSEVPERRKQANDLADDSERVDVICKSIYGSLYHYGERLRMGTCRQDENEGTSFILQRLGLFVSEEGQLQLTWLSRQRFTDVHACIRYHVKSSVASCRSILLNMQRYEGVPEKQAYLIQRFLIERFSFFYRVSLYRNFNHGAYESPSTIHPVAWILGWLFVIGSVVFFLVWILLWGSANAHGVVVKNWGINFSLANLHEVFIFSVARIFFLNILAIDSIRPRLERIRAFLGSKTAADEEVPAEGTRVEGQTYLLQYLEPSLLAAKLSGARQLETISDAELWKLSKGPLVPSSSTEDAIATEVEDEGMGATIVSKGIPYSASKPDVIYL